ncbi:MAG: methylenetetrahydrofolate reductase [Hyphomicrobiales bacterium]
MTEDLGTLFPKGTRVYLTDVGIDPLDTIVAAAVRLKSFGYVPVPHIPARRIETLPMLETRIARLRNEAEIEDVLLIAGEAERQMGPYSSSLEILQTDVLSRNGIGRIGVAGHPEGSPVMSHDVAIASLKAKSDFSCQTDADMYVVTQFGFDVARFIVWADALPSHGIFLPVHLGMAGPAKMTTLIKYAAICGVGASMSFLKTRGSALASLAMGYDPEPIMADLQAYISTNPHSKICSAHIFPFGGLKKSANWLDERGTWDIKKSLYLDANVV